MKNRILVIDDEEDICVLLSQVLRTLDYQVEYALTIKEGMTKLYVGKPMLVFLDINLPDGSGHDLVPKLKVELPDIKVCMISADDGIKDRELSKKNGADYFIGKPLTRDKINEALSKIM